MRIGKIIRLTLAMPAAAIVLAALAGCAPQAKVMDEQAVGAIRVLAVLPMDCPLSGIGPAAGASVLRRLADQQPNIAVFEGPAIWRLAGDRPAAVSDELAAKVAAGMNADAAVTGTVAYAEPPGLKESAVAELTVKIVSAKTGKVIYLCDGRGADQKIFKALGGAAAQALAAFEYVRKNPKNKPSNPETK
ncbi:MAG: hypothetical protein HZA50_17725 [Planctomycetes bacterium]|nr:hypothetical protein [Planctomycetota bacterium]